MLYQLSYISICWGNRIRTYDFHDVSVTLFHWAIPQFVLRKGIEPLIPHRKCGVLNHLTNGAFRSTDKIPFDCAQGKLLISCSALQYRRDSNSQLLGRQPSALPLNYDTILWELKDSNFLSTIQLFYRQSQLSNADEFPNLRQEWDSNS